MTDTTRASVPSRDAAHEADSSRSDANAILSLESRLLVALAARGEQRIGRFIADASPRKYADDVYDWLFDISDSALVSALERYAFSGERDGFRLPASQEPNGRDGSPPAGTEGGE